jgi:hypothetical protein
MNRPSSRLPWKLSTFNFQPEKCAIRGFESQEEAELTVCSLAFEALPISSLKVKLLSRRKIDPLLPSEHEKRPANTGVFF